MSQACYAHSALHLAHTGSSACVRLAVSQDIFQRKLDSNVPNVSGIADDLIISGSTEQEHDNAFIQVMETAKKHNIGFNSEKLQFKQSKVNLQKIACSLLKTNYRLSKTFTPQTTQTLLGMVT